jgi:hypothetical protein
MTTDAIYEPDYRFTSKPRMNAEKSDWAGVINATLNDALAGEENARSWFLDNGEEFQFVCALADVKPAQVSEYAKRRMDGVVFPKPKARPMPKAEAVVVAVPEPLPMPEPIILPVPAFVAELPPMPVPVFVAMPEPLPVIDEKPCHKPKAKTQRGRLFEHNGEAHSLAEWSKITGIKHGTLYRRIVELGWPVGDALTTNKMAHGTVRDIDARTNRARNRSDIPRYEYAGKHLTLSEWSKETGIPRRALKERVYRMGWAIEEALTTPVLKRGEYIHARDSREKVAEKPKRETETQSANVVADDTTKRTDDALAVCREAVTMSVSNAVAHVKPVVSTLRGYLSRGLRALAEKVAA